MSCKVPGVPGNVVEFATLWSSDVVDRKAARFMTRSAKPHQGNSELCIGELVPKMVRARPAVDDL